MRLKSARPSLYTSNLVQILQEAQSADATLRDDAERKLRHMQVTDAAGFLHSLSRELASADKPVDTRRLAGLILKNALDAKDEKRKVREFSSCGKHKTYHSKY